MSNGFRVLLHIFQVLALLAALLFMTFTFLMTYFDFGATDLESHFVGTWAIGFGILSVAFSPTLWSLARGGAAAPASAPGGYDRAAEPPPPRHGAFEPLGGDRAPAPPDSSYGRPGGGFGGAPQAGTPPRQGESPWGGGR